MVDDHSLLLIFFRLIGWLGVVFTVLAFFKIFVDGDDDV
jgi:hypothetical protein